MGALKEMHLVRHGCSRCQSPPPALESLARCARQGTILIWTILPPALRGVLDAVDLHLLRLLSEDSRRSQRALARSLGMSPPAIAERINRLERSGIIRGYTIDVDWPGLGLPLLAFIDVVSTQGAVQRRLLERSSQLPSVHAVEIVTGSSDLRVHLRVRDHSHLRDVLFGDILPLEEIERTDTLISLKPGVDAPQEFHGGFALPANEQPGTALSASQRTERHRRAVNGTGRHRPLRTFQMRRYGAPREPILGVQAIPYWCLCDPASPSTRLGFTPQTPQGAPKGVVPDHRPDQ